MIPIDWERITRSASYYSTIGYMQVDVPWVVERKFAMATCPEERFLVTSDFGELVGSAEQGFIQQDYLGLLGKGKFQAITPCFRTEDVLDFQHQRTFLKLELYVNDGDLFKAMEEMATNAKTVARGFVHEKTTGTGIILPSPILVEVDGGLDLMMGGIELGSFGVRTFEHVAWAFGTGHAEPRLSSTINMFIDRVNQIR